MEASKPSAESRRPSPLRRLADFIAWHAYGKYQMDEAVRRHLDEEERQRIPGYPMVTMDIDTREVRAYDEYGREVHPDTNTLIERPEPPTPPAEESTN